MVLVLFSVDKANEIRELRSHSSLLEELNFCILNLVESLKKTQVVVKIFFELVGIWLWLELQVVSDHYQMLDAFAKHAYCFGF